MTKAIATMPPSGFNCVDQAGPTWLERADVCAEVLATVIATHPSVLAVADVGCGDQKLREALQARGLRVRYRGFDLVPQAADVQRFDVRRDTLEGEHDVIVMLGVIEYLAGLPVVLGRLATQAKHLVLSHVVRRDDLYTSERLSKLGWINHLSDDELVAVLVDAGYAITAQRITPDGRTTVIACVSRSSVMSA